MKSFQGQDEDRFPLSVLLLLIRVGVGMVFFKAGLLKYNSWEFTVLLFRDEYKVPLLAPELAARIAMVQELTLPILLFVGLGARLATLPCLACWRSFRHSSIRTPGRTISSGPERWA